MNNQHLMLHQYLKFLSILVSTSQYSMRGCHWEARNNLNYFAEFTICLPESLHMRGPMDTTLATI